MNFYKKGLTALEVLIAIAIIAILVALVLPNFSAMRKNQTLKNAAEDVASSLRTAKSQSLASINSSEYGVHFEETKIVIFKGKTYLQNSPDNITIDIIAPASISNVTLGGVSGNIGDVYFQKISGDPSLSGSVTVSIPNSSKTINLSAVGAVTIN